MPSLFILIIKNFKNRWKRGVMLINDKVKLINVARQFAKAPSPISFFGSSCYVKSCYMLGKIL